MPAANRPIADLLNPLPADGQGRTVLHLDGGPSDNQCTAKLCLALLSTLKGHALPLPFGLAALSEAIGFVIKTAVTVEERRALLDEVFNLLEEIVADPWEFPGKQA